MEATARPAAHNQHACSVTLMRLAGPTPHSNCCDVPQTPVLLAASSLVPSTAQTARPVELRVIVCFANPILSSERRVLVTRLTTHQLASARVVVSALIATVAFEAALLLAVTAPRANLRLTVCIATKQPAATPSIISRQIQTSANYTNVILIIQMA